MSDLKRFLSQYYIITANGDKNSSAVERVSSEEFLSSSLVGSDVIVLTRKDLSEETKYTLLKEIVSMVGDDWKHNKKLGGIQLHQND